MEKLISAKEEQFNHSRRDFIVQSAGVSGGIAKVIQRHQQLQVAWLEVRADVPVVYPFVAGRIAAGEHAVLAFAFENQPVAFTPPAGGVDLQAVVGFFHRTAFGIDVVIEFCALDGITALFETDVAAGMHFGLRLVVAQPVCAHGLAAFAQQLDDRPAEMIQQTPATPTVSDLDAEPYEAEYADEVEVLRTS